MAVTIKEIARKLKIHHSTVSRALNGNRSIPAITRDKILEMAKSLDYYPNQLARSLTRGRTNCVGLILPRLNQMTSAISAQTLGSVGQAAEEKGYALFLNAYAGKDFADILLGAIKKRFADGVIVIAGNVTPEIEKVMTETDFPMVFLDNFDARESFYSVYSDNADSGRKAIGHLLSLGHKRIGLLARTSYQAGRTRIEGYKAALAENDIPVDDALIKDLYRVTDIETIWREFSREADPPTAIYSTEFQYTVKLLDHLKELGVRVPDDLSIVTYDDVYLFDHIAPPLTAIRQKTELFGEIAVDMLDKIINKDPIAEKQVAVPVELIVRGSSGPARRDGRAFLKKRSGENR